MAILRVNACGDRPVPHRSPSRLAPLLRHALAAGPGPVTVLLHGYRYRPEQDCPHEQIFSLTPKTNLSRVISWPHHLGYAQDRPALGVLICFGWDAQGTVQSAYGRAAKAGRALAALVDMVRNAAPNRDVNVLSHSMGARVALQALHDLPLGAMNKLILMAAAEYKEPLRAALDTPAGHHAQVLHVTSRENDLYDFLLERFVSSAHPKDIAVGQAQLNLPNLRTLWLDHAGTLRQLHGLGFRIPPPRRRICHWSPYLRPGVFALYRALLSGELSIAQLDAALPVVEPVRWSPLRSRALRLALPLPALLRRSA